MTKPKAGGRLVVTGPYRWLRHPICTAILVIVLGLWLRQPTLLLASAAVLGLGFLVTKTPYEERC